MFEQPEYQKMHGLEFWNRVATVFGVWSCACRFHVVSRNKKVGIPRITFIYHIKKPIIINTVFSCDRLNVEMLRVNVFVLFIQVYIFLEKWSTFFILFFKRLFHMCNWKITVNLSRYGELGEVTFVSINTALLKEFKSRDFHFCCQPLTKNEISTYLPLCE